MSRFRFDSRITRYKIVHLQTNIRIMIFLCVLKCFDVMYSGEYNVFDVYTQSNIKNKILGSLGSHIDNIIFFVSKNSGFAVCTCL